MRLGNNRDKDNSLTKKLGLHAFVNLQEDFSICVVFCSEEGLLERVLLVEVRVGAGDRGEYCECRRA